MMIKVATLFLVIMQVLLVVLIIAIAHMLKKMVITESITHIISVVILKKGTSTRITEV